MRSRTTPLESVLIGVLALWFAGSVLSQHPSRTFDRVRSWLGTNLRVPDWRFFAPEPGRTDSHVLVRVVRADGSAEDWRATHVHRERAWWHALYFPEHRLDKGFFDVVSGLSVRMQSLDGPFEGLAEYRAIVEHARGFLRRDGVPADAAGFQFMIVEDAGHDEDADMEIRLLSRQESLARD